MPDLDQFHLDGKVAIVVGGGRGIGAGIARALGGAGATVAVVSRTEEQAKAVADDITTQGSTAVAMPADVYDLAAIPSLIDRVVSELGGIDIVTYSAGGGYEWRSFQDMNVEDLQTSFHANVLAPFELTRLAVPHLLQSPNASVTYVTSITTTWALRGHLIYEVPKTGLNQLTRSLSADLAPKIRVNAILPNAIGTENLQQVFDRQPQLRAQLEERIRMRRVGRPDDIGNAVVYLASDAASWVTGVLLEVTGGPMNGAGDQFADL
jgi:7-alpha-hydroxysteroid dehydrogenase